MIARFAFDGFVQRASERIRRIPFDFRRRDVSNVIVARFFEQFVEKDAGCVARVADEKESNKGNDADNNRESQSPELSEKTRHFDQKRRACKCPSRDNTASFVYMLKSYSKSPYPSAS